MKTKNSKVSNKNIYRIICGILLLNLFLACEKEDSNEEACMEEICPDGFNSCIERPCDFDDYIENN